MNNCVYHWSTVIPQTKRSPLPKRHVLGSCTEPVAALAVDTLQPVTSKNFSLSLPRSPVLPSSNGWWPRGLASARLPGAPSIARRCRPLPVDVQVMYFDRACRRELYVMIHDFTSFLLDFFILFPLPWSNVNPQTLLPSSMIGQRFV